MTIRINASELHQRVGDILAQIRYTGERVIIERRGKPVAAVISIEELEQLGPPKRRRSRAERRATLARAAALRNLISIERKGKPLPNSVEVIRQIREERTRHVAGGR
jgi:prevent-host-death family protein